MQPARPPGSCAYEPEASCSCLEHRSGAVDALAPGVMEFNRDTVGGR